MPTKFPTFVPDYLRGDLNAPKYRDVENAVSRAMGVANTPIRFVDLSVSTGDIMQLNDLTVVFTATGAGSTFTFNLAAPMGTTIVALVNNGGSAVALTPAGNNTIDTASIPKGARYWFQSDGVSAWYRISDTNPPANTPTQVYGEIPSGVVNGVNKVFTLANTPITGTVQLYQAGQRIDNANFTMAGAQITCGTAPVAAVAPTTSIEADYKY